ncbi:hypothetical protein PCYB_032090 [Plasmodium cynomolgi strain B]|uniref:Uncharacterized protein n=1 Tax=Plasmodium cynomolgi (strain B) TaxID=1120755 RepID=K6UCG2_PLACD|nr:hypothetical protein PCYB_032090 [Plasmodium cynomolgi strain B]GAB64796.1 hypothetical protein PCYB_032090 [Plasmodium cynomolgi strain B]
MKPESEDRRGDKEREVILLGILNIENVYGKDWIKKKKEVKKDLQSKSVKLNQAFKNPAIFHERFEFLSAEDFSCVKNNYIYSAIVIFNPNLGGNSLGGEEPVSEEGDIREDAPPLGQAKVKNTSSSIVHPPSDVANKPFNVSRNNFFNMTAYIYGSSNLLANTSLILREYGDDEWAERLRRTKKGKEQARGGPPPGAQDSAAPREGGLIKTFTSLFKK